MLQANPSSGFLWQVVLLEEIQVHVFQHACPLLENLVHFSFAQQAVLFHVDYATGWNRFYRQRSDTRITVGLTWLSLAAAMRFALWWLNCTGGAALVAGVGDFVVGAGVGSVLHKTAKEDDGEHALSEELLRHLAEEGFDIPSQKGNKKRTKNNRGFALTDTTNGINGNGKRQDRKKYYKGSKVPGTSRSNGSNILEKISASL